MKILVIHGPNLNLLGSREPEVYGAQTLDEVNAQIEAHASSRGVETEFFQSNHEGAIIDAIHGAAARCAGIVINPAAHSHYSIAIHDALKAVDVPAIEVHLSDISKREEFRRTSVTAPACVKQISGLGVKGYLLAIDELLELGL